ncbi:tetratricopeptide repeat protein [Larkinella insperata]|uniref:histidine kinase n=1 Tax=Larkinella insperata TaxID=332158 RepID=A0ABW3Q8N5_9BACT|nr:tetratricopeptide repeat protein [Larkinella insperata]
MQYKRIVFFIVSAVCGFLVPGPPVAGQKPKNMAELERLVKQYRYHKPDSATYFAQQGMALARRQKDSTGVARMLVQLGMIDDNQGQYEQSEKKYRQALALFRKAGEKKSIATVTIRIGVVHLRNGNYDEAIRHFLQALKTSEGIGDAFGQMEANYSISWAHLDQQHYDQALRYLKIAERYDERLPFSNISLNICNHFGVIYRQTGDLKTAKHYLEKGIRLSNNKLEYQGLNITLINNLAAVYAKEGQKEKAIQLQEQALARSRAIDNYLRELQSLFGLAKTYGNDNLPKAVFYARQAVLLARAKGAHRQEMRYLKDLTGFYKAQSNYKEALTTKEREHALADSFFYKSMSEHIDALKSEYELSKSRDRIKQLNLINKQNELELGRSSLIRNVTFAGITLLLIILGLLYNQSRINQRNNREIAQKNQSLQSLVEEKEWLLKEIHHRVKNNLQIITSLLNSQSIYLKDKAALSAIRESQNRVHAMALLHQNLYQSERLSSIPMDRYIADIVDYLIDSFEYRSRLKKQLEVTTVELDVTLAVPLGLIINEAVTNSLKYAFLPDQDALIAIALHAENGNAYRLRIRDNGVGLPIDFDPRQSRSLGLTLIRGLSKQIGGTLEVTSQDGVQIELTFGQNPLA